MIPAALREKIETDRAAGTVPFLVVATAGTTGAGAVDPLPELAEIAREAGLWYHVDAAWGGAAALVPELRPVLDGIERADSVTFDAHKLLSVPMGAGMFFTPIGASWSGPFASLVHARASLRPSVVDPYSVSIRWSRRFIGLKLFLSLLVAGGRVCGGDSPPDPDGRLLRERLGAGGGGGGPPGRVFPGRTVPPRTRRASHRILGPCWPRGAPGSRGPNSPISDRLSAPASPTTEQERRIWTSW
jgi:hypothetical protein